MVNPRTPVTPTHGRPNRFKKLRHLQCYQEVYDRLTAGWGLTELARFIQEERGEYKEIPHKGLVEVLKAFRKEIPAGDLVAKRFPEEFQAAKETFISGINEVRELEELYRIQMHRITTDFTTEKNIGKLLPSMTSEMKEARQLLESLAKLKMDLGLMDRVAQKHSHDVSVEVEATMTATTDGLADQFGSPAVKKVLSDPESRRKVQGVVERFLRLSAVEGAKEA
jgi:hypothetical protein